MKTTLYLQKNELTLKKSNTKGSILKKIYFFYSILADLFVVGMVGYWIGQCV